jgi:major type 1 subunit fimbrin (pilin)
MGHKHLICSKIVLRSLFFSACLFIIGLANAAESEDTQVDFSGTLVSRPCNISPESLTQNVEFGNVPVKAFLNDGTTSPEFFELNLTDCKPEKGGVSVTFSSDAGADSAVTDAFALNGNRTIALRLAYRGEGSEAVIVSPDSTGPSRAIDATDINLPFQASLVTADATKVNAGEFSLSVTATFEYD